MGAWIEIMQMVHNENYITVAPLVGAWIEIIFHLEYLLNVLPSLLSWERGLKSDYCHYYLYLEKSLLSWERGLKSISALVRLNCDCRSSRGSVD